jgi:hypothetical protein
MKNWLITTGLKLAWLALGKLGHDLLEWIKQANDRKLTDRDAFEYVWRKAKTKYADIGDWLLNLVIEVAVGKSKLSSGKFKLKWPARLKF